MKNNNLFGDHIMFLFFHYRLLETTFQFFPAHLIWAIKAPYPHFLILSFFLSLQEKYKERGIKLSLFISSYYQDSVLQIEHEMISKGGLKLVGPAGFLESNFILWYNSQEIFFFFKDKANLESQLHQNQS